MSAQRLALVDREEAEPRSERAPAVGTLRVAIATQDMKTLNAHFGSARTFAVFDVTRDSRKLVEAVRFSDTSDESGSHKTDGDDKIGPKVAALAGCHLLFVLAIGGPAAAKVVSARMHPIKVPSPEPIESVLDRVQTMLSGNPPPWLRRVLNTGRPADFLED